MTAHKGKRAIPLDGNGELPRTGARLDNNVGLLDAAGEELFLCASDEGLDDGRVPAGVDDGDAQVRAIVVLRGGALERRHCGWAKDAFVYVWCSGVMFLVGNGDDSIVNCLLVDVVERMDGLSSLSN